MTDVQALAAQVARLEQKIEELDARTSALVDNVNELRNPKPKRKTVAVEEGA